MTLLSLRSANCSGLSEGERGKTSPAQEAPKDLEKGIIVMQQPVQNLYLVSSSVMDIFDHLDALDSIRFSSQKEEDWYIEGAKKAMARGDISYAGKYSKPDYEQIVSQKCTLAI